MDDAEDELSFDTVLWRTQARIRAFIAGMGVASHDVDDVAQDVYLELYRNFSRLPSGTSPEQWLKGIARNLCMNHFRRSSRRRRLQREALAEMLIGVEATLEQPPTDIPIAAALEECVAKLPAEQREMIELRYHQELTSDAIAQRLNSTAEAIRLTLYRVRAALKSCVARTVTGMR